MSPEKMTFIKLDGLGEDALNSFAAYCSHRRSRNPWLYGGLKRAIQSEIERRRSGSKNDPVLPLDGQDTPLPVLLSAADECLRISRWFLDLGGRRDFPLEVREQCLFLTYIADQLLKFVVALLLESQPGVGDTRAPPPQMVN